MHGTQVDKLEFPPQSTGGPYCVGQEFERLGPRTIPGAHENRSPGANRGDSRCFKRVGTDGNKFAQRLAAVLDPRLCPERQRTALVCGAGYIACGLPHVQMRRVLIEHSSSARNQATIVVA